MMRATVVAVSLAALFAGCGRELPEKTGGGTLDAGSGMGGGSAGGDSGGGGGSAPACGVHAPFGPKLVTLTFGMKDGGVYEGPATVERSTPEEVVIAFQPAGVELPSHAKLYGQVPIPAFPVGAQVWLTKSPAGDPSYPPFGTDPSWA